MRVGLLGVGTVGSGVVEMLQDCMEIEIVRMLDVKVRMPRMTTDPDDIFCDESIDTVVETMGGIMPAADFARRALNAGKPFCYGEQGACRRQRQGAGRAGAQAG